MRCGLGYTSGVWAVREFLSLRAELGRGLHGGAALQRHLAWTVYSIAWMKSVTCILSVHVHEVLSSVFSGSRQAGVHSWAFVVLRSRFLRLRM